MRSLRRAFDDVLLTNSRGLPFHWSKLIPGKVNICAWRTLRHRLPTKMNLVRRGMTNITTTCSWCGSAEETEDHLFVTCDFPKKILSEFCAWWAIDPGDASNISDLFNTCCSKISASQCELFIAAFYTYIWELWYLRNSLVHSDTHLNHSILSHIQAQSFFWVSHRMKNKEKAAASLNWFSWCNNTCF